jgi:hypothetical protein
VLLSQRSPISATVNFRVWCWNDDSCGRPTLTDELGSGRSNFTTTQLARIQRIGDSRERRDPQF